MIQGPRGDPPFPIHMHDTLLSGQCLGLGISHLEFSSKIIVLYCDNCFVI